MCERRGSVEWPDKKAGYCHTLPVYSHEHFVIIFLVLQFPGRGVEVRKVRLRDVRPKFGQISTPMSTTKNIKQRESTVAMKNGAF